MSLKNRRFSLDSSIMLDGAGLLTPRRGSALPKISKRSRTSADEGELSPTSGANGIFREPTIAEESLDRLDGIINTNGFQKHNKTFHKLFPDIPEGENLTHSFVCALQKEVLYHGKLFVSQKYVCFHSSVLLKDTKVVIRACSVRVVKKPTSALSRLSIHTDEGEKYSFASLRKRDMCYKLLQSICSNVQGGSCNSSPHASSAENEGEHDVESSLSCHDESMDHNVTSTDHNGTSMDHNGTSMDHNMSRQNSIFIENSFPQLATEDTTRHYSSLQSSLTNEDNTALSRIQWMIESVTPFLFLREIRSLGVLFYIYMMLTLLLLLASGYIGLRIIALEEQLDYLGTLTELSLHNRNFMET